MKTAESNSRRTELPCRCCVVDIQINKFESNSRRTELPCRSPSGGVFILICRQNAGLNLKQCCFPAGTAELPDLNKLSHPQDQKNRRMPENPGIRQPFEDIHSVPVECGQSGKGSARWENDNTDTGRSGETSAGLSRERDSALRNFVPRSGAGRRRTAVLYVFLSAVLLFLQSSTDPISR